MATDLRNGTETSFATLVSGIIRDAQELIKQEVALARREIADEVNKTKQAVVSLGLAIGVGTIGAWLLLLMIVELLHEEAQLKLWLSYLIVGGVLAILGVAFFFMAKARMNSVRLVPRQTVETMKENVQWIKNQT